MPESTPACSSEHPPARPAAAVRAAHPPAYDPDKRGYAGISAGALDDPDVRAARDFAEMIVDTVREGLLVLDLDLRVKAANESFYRAFGVRPEETVGREVFALGDGQWDIPELRVLLEDLLPADGVLNDYEVQHDFPGVGRRVMLLNARRLNHHRLILLAIEDLTARRSGERELAASTTAFDDLAGSVPQLVWTADPDGTVRYYTEHVRRYAGLEQRADGTWSWRAVVHPDDAARTDAAWQRAVARAQPYEIEHRLRMADNTYRWHVSRARPARDDAGAVERWYGTATDVQSLKGAEAAVRASEARYRALFESMDQGYCVLEMLYDAAGRPADYRFVEANPAFEAQTGLVDPVGQTARALVPGLEDHWVQAYARVAETGMPERFEQGSEAMGRWFDVYASRVGGPESRRVALLFSDVTARRQADQARRANERRYLALFEQAPAFIAVLRGPEHRFQFVNPAFLDVVGHRALLERPVREALPEVEGQGLFEALDRVYHDGESFTAVDRPVNFRRSSAGAAERRYVDFVYQPLRRPDGSITGVIVLGIDTTERVQAREALDRANRELERRVEARTAQVRELARALTLAEQRERQRIAYVLHDDLQQVLFGAQMAAAVGDVAQLRSILEEATVLTRTLSHDLSAPLLEGEDLEDLLRWLAERKRERHGLDVEVEVEDGSPLLVNDPALRVLLYQLVRELLFNVVKHAGTGAARVLAGRTDSHVRITVADEGAGFDPAVLERPTRGMGLASVRERLALVGGRLEIDAAPGRGVRVTIAVPVADPPAEA